MRLFVGIGLDDEVRDAVAERMRWLKPRVNERQERWTFTRAENLHFTLKFLGEVEEARLAELGEALGRAAAGVPPMELELADVGCFPNARRPRVLWIGVREGAAQLVHLASRVEEQLVARGFAPEERGFSPHLTVGRLRRGTSPAPLEKVLQEAPRNVIATQPVREVVLYESTLSPGGSIYEMLVSVPLIGRHEAEAPRPHDGEHGAPA